MFGNAADPGSVGRLQAEFDVFDFTGVGGHSPLEYGLEHAAIVGMHAFETEQIRVRRRIRRERANQLKDGVTVNSASTAQVDFPRSGGSSAARSGPRRPGLRIARLKAHVAQPLRIK